MTVVFYVFLVKQEYLFHNKASRESKTYLVILDSFN